MIEENVQEQEEFPESKPAEKERFTDRVLTREVTLKGITFQMVDILFTACLRSGISSPSRAYTFG